MHQRLRKLRNFLTVAQNFTKPGFASLLGTEPKKLINSLAQCNISADVHEKQKKDESSINEDYSYSFRYKIPQHACFLVVPHSAKTHHDNVHTTKQSILPLSGYLALFDDFTTLALINEDKQTRPGLSISLSAQLHPNYMTKTLPKANSEIDVQVHVTKIGKIFGFAKARAICCESNSIIATGNHVKYLPGGSLIHRFALDSRVLPYIAKIAIWFGGSISSMTTTSPQLSQSMSMDEALFMKNYNSNFSVKGYHCNPVESLHVGIL